VCIEPGVVRVSARFDGQLHQCLSVVTESAALEAQSCVGYVVSSYNTSCPSGDRPEH
jgi:hypothetical protein